MVSRFDWRSNSIRHMAVNSCLMPVACLHGLAVTTVEGIGSVKRQLHPVQERLAKAHGSQCGFCTPGIVMSMYSLLRGGRLARENDSQQRRLEILDNAFQGNLCRCTGYRSILQAYSTFVCGTAGESNPAGVCALGSQCCRVKDGGQSAATFACNKSSVGDSLFDSSSWKDWDESQELTFPAELQLLSEELDSQSLEFHQNNLTFNRPSTLEEVLYLRDRFPDSRILVGNTEIAIDIRQKAVQIGRLIHCSRIKELNQIRLDLSSSRVLIGAAATLTELDDFLEECCSRLPGEQIKTLVAMHEMLHWFAGPQIRNVASIGGNIITASPISDLNPILLAAPATLLISSKDAEDRRVEMNSDFFLGYRRVDLRPGEVLREISVPLTTEAEFVHAFKQAHRREDDISIVNACLYVSFHEVRENPPRVNQLRLVYGGMAVTTVVVNVTEAHDKLWNSQLLTSVLQLLQTRFRLQIGTPGGYEAYRTTLVLSFFYRFYHAVWRDLNLQNSEHEEGNNSALDWIPKHFSQSLQLFELTPSDQPQHDAVGRPLMHMSALKQATGEAVYVDDLPCQAGELHLALVVSSRAHARILSVDTSQALAITGVVGYADQCDIPAQGSNCYNLTIHCDEKVFADGLVTTVGQVIGVVAADSHDHAVAAARAVQVAYSELDSVLTVDQAVAADSFHYVSSPVTFGDRDLDDEAVWQRCAHVFSGRTRTGGQEHFYLEPHVVRCCETEAGDLEATISGQDLGAMQRMVSTVMGLPNNRVKVTAKRLGGGFGGKELRPALLLGPAVVCARKFGRTVRCCLDRFDDMLISGTRSSSRADYRVGVDEEGRVLLLDIRFYLNAGNTVDLSKEVGLVTVNKFYNAYRLKCVRSRVWVCRTNMPSNTAFRGFGVPQALFAMEGVLTRIAAELRIPQEKVREINMVREGDLFPYGQPILNCTVNQCWSECLARADYYGRRAALEAYNRSSRWKKRGLAAMPLVYGIGFLPAFLNQGGAKVSIFRDGSVLLQHGGVEMGQGLHTKMIQVASRALGVCADRIHIKETCVDAVPNASSSAASFSTDLNGRALMDACSQIVARLQPVRERLGAAASWDEVVLEAYLCGISLSSSGFFFEDRIQFDEATMTGRPYAYYSQGAACAEVEIDCLTGDHVVRRVDIVMDVGKSLNPAIDVGQIEGGFVQGYGLFVLEEQRVLASGHVFTRGPGTYKIPGFQDIPQTFNVFLLTESRNQSPHSVYSSKAIGEPPLLLALSVHQAIRDAVESARIQCHTPDCGFFQLDAPATAERIRMACVDFLVQKMDEDESSGKRTPWEISLS